MSTFWLVFGPIFGGLISGVIGFSSQWLTDARRRKFATKLFVQGLIEDLRHYITMSKRIEEDYRKSGIIYFNLINSIYESRGHYLRNRDFVLGISDSGLRAELQEFYRHSNDLLTGLQNGQQRLDEIRRLIGDRAQNFWNQDNRLTYDQVFARAEQMMQVEVGERQGLNILIPRHLEELRESRAVATRLSDLLSGQ